MDDAAQKTREQLLLELEELTLRLAGGRGDPRGHPQRRRRRARGRHRPGRGAALHARGRRPRLPRLPRVHQRGRRHPRRRRPDPLRQRGRAPAPVRRGRGARGRPPLQGPACARTSVRASTPCSSALGSAPAQRRDPRARPRRGGRPLYLSLRPLEDRGDQLVVAVLTDLTEQKGDRGGARVRAARPVHLRAGGRADHRVRQGRRGHPREPGGGRARRPGAALPGLRRVLPLCGPGTARRVLARGAVGARQTPRPGGPLRPRRRGLVQPHPQCEPAATAPDRACIGSVVTLTDITGLQAGGAGARGSPPGPRAGQQGARDHRVPVASRPAADHRRPAGALHRRARSRSRWTPTRPRSCCSRTTRSGWPRSSPRSTRAKGRSTSATASSVPC